MISLFRRVTQQPMIVLCMVIMLTCRWHIKCDHRCAHAYTTSGNNNFEMSENGRHAPFIIVLHQFGSDYGMSEEHSRSTSRHIHRHIQCLNGKIHGGWRSVFLQSVQPTTDGCQCGCDAFALRANIIIFAHAKKADSVCSTNNNIISST